MSEKIAKVLQVRVPSLLEEIGFVGTANSLTGDNPEACLEGLTEKERIEFLLDDEDTQQPAGSSIESQKALCIRELSELKKQTGLAYTIFLDKFSHIICRLPLEEKISWVKDIHNALEGGRPHDGAPYTRGLRNSMTWFGEILKKLEEKYTSEVLVKAIKGLLEKRFRE